MTMILPTPPRASFLGLPPELRDQIYTELLSARRNKHPCGEELYCYHFHFSILRANRQIYEEARRVFRRENVFIRIETPWRQAEAHVQKQGRVPLLGTGEKAGAFLNYHLAATIDLPGTDPMYGHITTFIVCVDDLPLFSQMWVYSDLSHPGLNSHLRLQLRLQNPNQEFFPDQKTMLPVRLQRQLLLPFGMIKGLQSFSIIGDHEESLERSIQEEQAVPHRSPQQCLEEAEKFKEAGNLELKNGNYRQAIDLYVRSFHAVHIVVIGRIRHIWADAFFDGELDGTLVNSHAGLARMMLRIRLVANTILAYYRLGEFEEAKFWGMRSINLMREAVGAQTDQPQPNFPAADAWGKIFYRTALACKELGEMTDCRELLGVAARWLPRDEIVQKEVAACALRLG